jgi:hypothetical protein
MLNGKKIESLAHYEVVPQTPLQQPPATTGLYAMTCVFYLINEFDSRIKLNLFDSKLLFSFIFFLDRT